MVMCKDCKATFEVDKIKFVATGISFSTGICPHCQGRRLALASTCRRCNGILPQRQVHKGLCEDCLEAYVLTNQPAVIKYMSQNWDSFSDFLEAENV